jgi:hypothetical protein
MAATFVEVVRSEAGRLRGGQLTWDRFSNAWFRVVRRVIFGNAATEDHELSATMAKLRSAANWAFLTPQRRRVRAELHDRIRGYLRRAEPGSLAGLISHIDHTEATSPENQIPQWLFAFDPTGMTTFRSLALLATHPHYLAGAREEAANIEVASHRPPLLRATVHESLRLWPTTPLILRESIAATEWEPGTMPAHIGIIIFAPFFHRDSERLPYADRFFPEVWLNEEEAHGWPLIPFSEGPAMCPGRHLVLLLSTAMLASLLQRRRAAADLAHATVPGNAFARHVEPFHASIRLTIVSDARRCCRDRRRIVRRLDRLTLAPRRARRPADGGVGAGAFARQLGRREPHHSHGLRGRRDLHAHGAALSARLEGTARRILPHRCPVDRTARRPV